MDNAAIARVLTELADVLELSGETVFKVRAFRTAARAIEGLGERAEELLASGGLAKVKGVGDGVIRRLKELRETGKIAELEAARAKLPPGITELMNLPGIGLKTAQQVWKERGITTIEELEAAARAGSLRTLPRFGDKREEKLILAIEAFRKRASQPKRRPMAEALELAEALVAKLGVLPGVVSCQYAGSLRRRMETVGDLDILVSADAAHAGAILDAFCAMPEVTEHLGKGDTKASVVLDNGMQADLRVVPEASFGAALQYFTGSKDHNVAMRTIAVKHGLKVSEYGVFDASGKSLAGPDEAGVYRAVGLAWMPPELRENRGEIEASQDGRLPALVEQGDIRGDLHMHTRESDGKSTIEEMAQAAIHVNYKYIAITDHSENLAIARGMTPERLRAHVRRIREADDALDGKIRLLAGVEADILADGSLDLEGELAELDWVVGSVHGQLAMPREQMTKRLVRAIESGKIDCVGHPTGRMLGHRDGSELDWEAVLDACARTGTAVELNSSPLRLDVTEHAARAARERGVPVVLNSDAHSTRELAFVKYGIGIARRAWLGKEHILNTRSREEIRAWRSARA